MDDAPDATPDNDPPTHDAGVRLFHRAAEKVRQFPTTPGVYLMKDAAGRVIYVKKKKNLRARASSYF
ncbi:MAG: excinuclease ABC subunit UvrC, partial [Planctomycetales bacterium]|nr:excinuclease ABC subunit UvrC [Planctomycetales bacterium]